VAANPLDARLRETLADGLRGRARALASIGEFKAAGTDVAEALRLRDGRPVVGHLALAAAIAFKAGDTDAAEDHVRTAWAIAPPAAAYVLAIEATRFKLANPLKQRFEVEFAAALAAPPTGPAAIALTEAFFNQTREGTYVGLKGHEKQVQAFAEAAIVADLAENDLSRLCDHLDRLDWLRLLKKATTIGQRRFPRNPFFPFFEATCHLTDDRASKTALWKIEPLLEKARRLAETAPPDDAIRKLFRDLDNIQQRFSMPPPVAEMFEQLFGMFDKD
jgi:tetratricopeptide (TPR) repeat protein